MGETAPKFEPKEEQKKSNKDSRVFKKDGSDETVMDTVIPEVKGKEKPMSEEDLREREKEAVSDTARQAQQEEQGLDGPDTEAKTQLRSVKDDEKGMGSDEYLFRKLLAKKTTLPDKLSKEERDDLARLSETYGKEFNYIKDGSEGGKETKETSGGLEIEVGAHSMKSNKHERSQDSYAYDSRRGLIIVADGLGAEGQEIGGEVASLITSRLIRKALEARMDQGVVLDSDDKAERFMLDAIRSANMAVMDLQDPNKYTKALESLEKLGILEKSELSELGKVHPENLQDMKTTASAMVFYENKSGDLRAVIGHIGDSRVYELGDEGLKQITTDHDPIADALEGGLINEDDAQNLDRTIGKCPKLLEHFEKANIRRFLENKFGTKLENVTLKRLNNVGVSKSIGTESIKPDVFTIKVESGRKFLLCTDGLNKNYPDSEIEKEMRSGESLQNIANELTLSAWKKAKKHRNTSRDDDITIAVVEAPIEEVEEAQIEEVQEDIAA